MKVKIEINPEISEITAIIYAPKLTAEVTTIVENLETMAESVAQQVVLLNAKKDDKFFIIEPKEVDIIRTEGGKIKLYTNKAKEYDLTKPLHEILDQLPSKFVRISKSTIVNITRVDHLSNSFNGTMYIVMKNGVNDYISRKYLGDFKKRLGM